MERLAKSSKRKISEFIEDFRVGDVQNIAQEKYTEEGIRGLLRKTSCKSTVVLTLGVEVNNSVEEDRKD